MNPQDEPVRKSTLHFPNKASIVSPEKTVHPNILGYGRNFTLSQTRKDSTANQAIPESYSADSMINRMYPSHPKGT